MNVTHFRQMLRAEPFQPFRIHLADGRDMDIDHPDFVGYTPTGRTVVITRLDETFEVINLLLVSTLEVLDGKRGNGRRARKKN